MEFIETMLCENGQVELLEFHLDRLKWGLYQNDIHSVNLILAQAKLTILSNLPEDSKKYKIRYLIHIDPKDNFLEKIEKIPLAHSQKSCLEIGIYNKVNKKIAPPWNAKTTERALYQSAMNWALGNELNDALILNENGHVIETSIYNIFILKNNVLFTPPISDMPVKGVFRTWLIQNSAFKIIEQSLSVKDILSADLILLTNAVQGIRLGKITQF
ncbi:MAG TPA: aminotransferase class IV [Chitinophagales bacterium]|nr:aminotransferase class IV [Chitinophagales bacterium]